MTIPPPVWGPPRAAQAPSGGPLRRALVVDDDAAVRQWVVRVLVGEQWLVAEAEDGEVARRLLDVPHGETVLLVTDLDMPRMDGIALLAWRAGAHPGAASILMSGARRADARAALRPHGVPMLDKPFSPHELRALVQRVTPSPPP